MGCGAMRDKPGRQHREVLVGMIVAHRPPRRLPHMFLRIEIGGGGRKLDQLQARMGRDQIANGGPAMPGRPIPQHQQRPIRIGTQELLTILGRGDRVQSSGLHDHLLARGAIERPVQARFGPSWITADGEWLPAWRPRRHCRRLEIQRRFIQRHNDRLWGRLRHVDQFFSIWASQSSTARALRDLKTVVGR